jgi:hypothetical protein
MKNLVIYDSQYGNTAEIARAIAASLGDNTEACSVTNVEASDLEGVTLLVIGSPTQGGRATVAIQALIKSLPANSLQDTAIAAFDTRLLASERGFALRLLMRMIGYAAPKIAAGLAAKGGYLVAQPRGFVVDGKEGPLREGELVLAGDWARTELRAPRRARAAA